MKREELERRFEAELIKNLEKAATLSGGTCEPLKAAIEKKGGVSYVKELLRRGEESPFWGMLKDKQALKYSAEALLTASRYAELFSDREADMGFSRLCEADFFG